MSNVLPSQPIKEPKIETKKLYKMTVSGESMGSTERYLTDYEYDLISSIFNEMTAYTTYENLTIEKIDE
jgi:hypothetical protein